VKVSGSRLVMTPLIFMRSPFETVRDLLAAEDVTPVVPFVVVLFCVWLAGVFGFVEGLLVGSCAKVAFVLTNIKSAKNGVVSSSCRDFFNLLALIM